LIWREPERIAAIAVIARHRRHPELALASTWLPGVPMLSRIRRFPALLAPMIITNPAVEVRKPNRNLS
jgi:hypothetical protein